MPASKYQDVYPEIAAALYRRGADDMIVAEVLGIGRRTLSDWRNRYPEFAASCRQSKALADSRVESALYHKAIGVFGPPDLGACMAWLCNRRPDLWRHVNRVEHTGPGGGPIEVSNADRRQAEERLTAEILEAAEAITRESSEG